MKRILLIIALLPLMAVAQERIMVIADPHVLAQSLVMPGEAMDNLMASQRKMLDLSEQAWYAIVDTALKYRPELVLIPGDLTKDSEKASHELVAASLQRLNEAGVQTLVIPGNHDLDGKAYAYQGEQRTSVENLPDSAWETMYDCVYSQVLAKDPNSHSYAAEPFAGVTVLGIDGAHGNASVGSLSDATLHWLLAQADSAHAKNHMIIAMSHWQMLEHIDKQQRLESSCRFKNADALRDSLMHHGVHVILTGHFHVNGITTHHDTINANDSIVEITTGSPITYPCPYRWLTLSHDRTSLTVTTQDLQSLPSLPDLQTYSREWMRDHARSMLPQMSLRVWGRVDEAKALIASQFGETVAELLVEKCIPATDSAKMALVDKYMGSTAVELYLLHSDANEPEHPEADSLALEVYSGMAGMIDEMLSADPYIKFVLGPVMTLYAQTIAEAPVQSLVEDVTNWGTYRANRTDDLNLTLTIADGYQHESLHNADAALSPVKILHNGQIIILRDSKRFTLLGQEIE
jgi:DNA repair exonuclease SbcCD nuclease subunit